MATGPPSLSRRSLLIGAAASAGGFLLRAKGNRAAPLAAPVSGAEAELPTSVADLSVRWRHLASGMRKTGVWTSLLAAWPFDEGSGYTFHDIAGGGHSLSITGDTWNTTDSGLLGAIHRAGYRGGAVKTNGRRWLAAAATSALAPDDRGLSVTAWVWLDSLPGSDATVISVGPHAALTIGPDGRASWSVTTSAGQRRFATSPDALAVASWNHLAASANPGAGGLTLLVNGVLSAHSQAARFSMPAPAPVHVAMGRGINGMLDETTVHRGPLTNAELGRIRIIGLPRTFTQTRETIDGQRQVFSRFKGSEPVPHPVVDGAVMNLRFATTLVSQQGTAPIHTPPADFLPVRFGAGWKATSEAVVYASPVTGPAGTFETWYQVWPDKSDPQRLKPHTVFTATARTSKAKLVLSTADGRWRIDLTSPTGQTTTGSGPVQPFPRRALAHVAVAWGSAGGGPLGAQLFIDGRPSVFVAADTGGTTFDGTLSLGGTASQPAACIFEDARISNTALGWGAVCPRGQAATESAGLDVRDFFQREPGLPPLLWRQGFDGGAPWTIDHRPWQNPGRVGDDPNASLAVWQRQSSGRYTLYHPDAFGYGSSIEAGVSVDDAADGWCGVFIQSAGQGVAFSGIALMIDVAQNLVGLFRYQAGAVAEKKTLPYDFTLSAARVYELTLTNTGAGVVRGFLDGSNVISVQTADGWPTSGWAGLITEGTAAAFSAAHFTALTPPTATSRAIDVRTIAYPANATATVTLVPFQWRKRRGMLPWEYVQKNPEPPGNIAGADTDAPLRPIGPARWRSEDSANSDLTVVDGTVWYFMRGDPSSGAFTWRPARIGVLYQSVEEFDGVHFVDPNLHTNKVRGGPFLLTASGFGPIEPMGQLGVGLNDQGTAYVGHQTLLLLGHETRDVGSDGQLNQTVYARFDLAARAWQTSVAKPVGWNDVPFDQRFRASSELVSLRDPGTDDYQAIVIGQMGPTTNARMVTGLVDGVLDGVPSLVPGSIVQFFQRPSRLDIYGFRVLFDNGIYYLHYNEGPQVPDWPDRFVLATALDPHNGPWIRNEDTNSVNSAYFRRGTQFEPDNGAIWQGTMVKHRGHYYLYYEAYHSIGTDMNQAYDQYGNPQAGSRVGFATAG